jgi:transcription initiation factor TFIIH subunit 2
MSDSDDDYVADDGSDDDIGNHQVSKRDGTRSSGPVRGATGSGTRGGDTNAGSNRRRAAWEDIQRSWDTVVEGADGSINSTVEGLREASKRKRQAVVPFGLKSSKLTL